MNIDRIWDHFLSFIFFQRCYNCRHPLGRRENFVCTDCSQIEYYPPSSPLFLPECTYLDEIHVVARYQSALEHAITEFKYRQNLSAFAFLRQILKTRLNEFDFSWAEAILPIPLFPAKKRKRGFNQSQWLASSISRQLSLPVRLDILSRCRNTPSQAFLDGALRRTNLAEAFQLIQPDRFTLQRLLLIDDVVTTGSTANECAFILKIAGAVRVELLALASRVLP